MTPHHWGGPETSSLIPSKPISRLYSRYTSSPAFFTQASKRQFYEATFAADRKPRLYKKPVLRETEKRYWLVTSDGKIPVDRAIMSEAFGYKASFPKDEKALSTMRISTSAADAVRLYRASRYEIVYDCQAKINDAKTQIEEANRIMDELGETS